ncbi:MAG TPA: NAD+ synthase [Patescibacteria group bacterium]|nr:NAD+ synthase [Patescibacteria group bacterium]
MKIALAQINPTVGDFSGNRSRILRFARQARERGADLAVFSELCLCGYLPHDLIERPDFVERNRLELGRLAAEIPLPAVVGYVGQARSKTGKRAANCAALISGGQILFEQQKMLLPTYDVFDESRYFQPAERQSVFPFHGSRLGLTICEDIWNEKGFWASRLYERDPVAELMAAGANLIVNISSSPFTIDKRALRYDMLRAIARQYRVPVVYVNQVGGNDSLVFDGTSVAVLADGRIAAQAAAFDEDLILFDTEAETGDVHAQPAGELDAVCRALVCGTRDYVCKCGFSQAVIGLSGGIDSSLVAAIAVEALGPENVLGVSMPGPYSSPASLRDAREVARNLGIRFEVLPIGDIFDAYRATMSPLFANLPEDVTEENFQARIRGNLLMGLSNKFGSLVLSAGNKSELAVGYCTLYGDMAGGLAVISDIPKVMVYELARTINSRQPVIPASVFTKAPSAELRANQTDQDSLPPYDVLDRILKAYVEDFKSAEEIAGHYELPLELVRNVATRVDRNEYKRQQAALGLKVTSKAFSVGRRFPIAQRYLT